MHYLARLAVPFAGLVAAALFATPSSAATVVDVSLWDKGASMPMGTGMTYGMMGANMSMATMGIKTPITAVIGASISSNPSVFGPSALHTRRSGPRFQPQPQGLPGAETGRPRLG